VLPCAAHFVGRYFCIGADDEVFAGSTSGRHKGLRGVTLLFANVCDMTMLLRSWTFDGSCIGSESQSSIDSLVVHFPELIDGKLPAEVLSSRSRGDPLNVCTAGNWVHQTTRRVETTSGREATQREGKKGIVFLFQVAVSTSHSQHQALVGRVAGADANAPAGDRPLAGPVASVPSVSPSCAPSPGVPPSGPVEPPHEPIYRRKCTEHERAGGKLTSAVKTRLYEEARSEATNSDVSRGKRLNRGQNSQLDPWYVRHE
jgi:hypothetical protein